MNFLGDNFKDLLVLSDCLLDSGLFSGHFFYGPLYLAATRSVMVCLRSACVDSSGRRLLDLFMYSALFGSAVDTCSRQFTEASCEGGPRLLIRRSIPSCLRMPGTFGRISYIFMVNVDLLLRVILVLFAVNMRQSMVTFGRI